MDGSLTTLVTVSLLLLATVVIGVLAQRYMQLQSQLNTRVQQQFDSWRDNELEVLRSQLEQAAQASARASLAQWQGESEANIRSDALRRSTAVITGKVGETLAPFIGAFPYNPRDVRFIGSPIDLIVFDGLSENCVKRVIFLEVKTGTGSLSARERSVRDAVLGKQILWQEFRPGG